MGKPSDRFRSDHQGWVEDITCICVGAGCDDVLGVMHVHGKVIRPEMPLPHSGGVEPAKGSEKSAGVDFLAHQ